MKVNELLGQLINSCFLRNTLLLGVFYIHQAILYFLKTKVQIAYSNDNSTKLGL